MSKDFSTSLADMINTLNRKIENSLDEGFKQAGINLSANQWSILKKVFEHEGISQKELVQQSGKDRSNIARITQKLELNGWVHKKAHPYDKRTFCFYISKQANAKKFELAQLSFLHLKKLTRHISDKEELHLVAMLQKLYMNLE